MSRARTWAIVSAVAALGVVAMAVAAPRAAAAGWLIAFTYVAAFPLGALALILIHRLTGGRWGGALMPLLAPLSRCAVLLVVLAVPMLVAVPWLMDFTPRIGNIAPSVTAIYLNAPSFIIRSVFGLVTLGALVLLIADATRLSAALGLLAYAVAINFLAIDWFLAIEPPFHSTSFGASVAIAQLLAVFALAALLDAAPTRRADLGSLLLATTLGLTYLDFMAVLVLWYGDVPSRSFWFVERLAGGWRWLAVIAFVLVSLLPTGLLLFARVRQSRAGLRVTGASVLVGLALYHTWLIAPAYGAVAAVTAPLAAVAMGAMIAAVIVGGRLSRLSARWRPAHGQ